MNLTSAPELLREKIVLSQDKLDDVNSLLENHFGENWRSQQKLNYFLKLLKNDGKKSVSKNKKDDFIVEEIEEGCIRAERKTNQLFYNKIHETLYL